MIRLIVLSLTLAAVSSLAQDEQYQPLEISAPETLVLAPDPRLDLGPEGTVEMWIAASASQPTAPAGAPAQELCILQSGDSESGENFRVSIPPNRAGLAIYRGSVSSGATQNFQIVGQPYIHIAFITAGGGTIMIVNGQSGGVDKLGVPTATPSHFQYLPLIPKGRALRVGCDGSGPTAHVWLRTLRLWDRALTSDELRWSSTFSGYPEGRPEVTSHLVAYSLFTDQRAEVRLTGPQIKFTEFAGADGDPFFLRRPTTQELAAIYVPFVTKPATGFTDLKMEFDGAARDFGLAGDAKTAYTLPTVVSIIQPTVDWIRAAFLRDILEPLEIKRDDPTHMAMYEQAFVPARSAMRNALLGFSNDQDGLSLVNGYSTLRLDIRAGARFRRIAGIGNGQYITNLRFESTMALGNLIPSRIPTGSEAFSLSLPPGARFEGIAGKRINGQISAIALAYSLPDLQDDPGLLSLETAGPVWIDRDALPPTRQVYAPSPGTPVGGPIEMTGDYSNQRAYRVQFDEARGKLSLTVVEPWTKGAAPVTFDFMHADGNRWVANSAKRTSELILEGGGIHWIGADLLYERRLVPGPIYEPPVPDKLPWGATFSLEQRPSMIEANFRGYFPYNMHARDFQVTTGVDKMVFAMPADASQNYTTTGSHIIVPYGLYFRLDNKGSEQEASFIYRTADERQFGWNVNVGASVGVPGIFSFSEDADYQHSQEVMASSQTSSTLTRSVATRYALVMDLARMKLDPEFQGRIFEMRDRYMTNLARDWKSFFLTFGTHYPYAVTYGGMAWMESYGDKMDVQSKNSEAVQLKAEASATFEGLFSIGGKLGGGYKASNTTGGGTESTVTVFGTDGGSFARGGGWSVGRGEEVPILLDLRPIYELFNPVFFEDPYISGALRAEAAKAWDSFVLELAESSKSQHPWSKIRVDVLRP